MRIRPLLSAAPRLARALASTVALAALLAGLPGALWEFGPHASRLPSGDQAKGWLTSPDDGHLLLGLFCAVAWALWAAFGVSLLLEVWALLRHRAAPAVRGMNGLQEITASLVGAIIVLAPAGTALAATPSATPSVTAPATPGAGTPAHPSDQAAVPTGEATAPGSPAANGPTYTITRPGATWWQIAADTLGDGARWQDVAALNPSLTADHLPIGTEVHLPPDAHLPADAGTPGPRTPTPHTTPDPSHTAAGRSSYTVHRGDTLSEIAEHELNDASRYPEVFALNQGEHLPDGGRFSDPDLIFPGQRLVLPATGHDQAATHAEHPQPRADQPDVEQPRVDQPSPAAPTTAPHTGSAQPGVPSPHSTHADGVTAPTHRDRAVAPATPAQATPPAAASSPAPPASAPAATSAPAAPSASAPTAPAPTAPTGAATVAPQEASTASSSRSEEAWAGGVAALLAAALLGVLGLRRILQHRSRRAGQTIAVEEPTPLERALTDAGEPETVERLDLALRTMAALAQETGAPLPPLRGAFVAGPRLGVVVDDADADALPPFTATEEPDRWVLDGSVELLSAQAAPAVPAPYPALVSVGTTDAGHLMLADLSATPVILLDGSADEVLEITRAMALEAASISWSTAEVFTVGLGGRLPKLLPHGRLRAMRHLNAAVSDLGALLLEAAQEEEPSGLLPWILVASSDADPDELWSLADAVTAAASVPVSVVLPASDAARRAFPEALVLDAARDRAASFPALSGGGGIRLQRMTDAEYRQLLHALEVADSPAQPAEEPWSKAIGHDVPATTPTEPAAPRLLPAHRLGDSGGDAAAAAAQPFPALISRPVRLATQPDASERTPAADPVASDPGPHPVTDTTASTPATSDAMSTEPEPADGQPDEAKLSPAAAEDPDDTPAEKDGVPAVRAVLSSVDTRALHSPRIPAPGPEVFPDESTVVGGDAFTDLPELTQHEHVVRVLGPVAVTSTAHLGQRNNLTPLAALIALRPGLNTEQLCEAMSPYEPWAVPTLRQRLAELRTALPSRDDMPALPRPRPGRGYRFAPWVTCDWDTFQKLAAHGLGPGRYRIQALEGALALVGGRPLDAPYPWAVALRQEMIARIVDVAHHLAVLHAGGDEPDYDAARQAVERGLLADVTAEVLYRDLMHIEQAAGHLLGLRHAVTRCRAAAQFHGLEVEPATEATIARLLGDPLAAGGLQAVRKVSR